jgi:hypothetical protein
MILATGHSARDIFVMEKNYSEAKALLWVKRNIHNP